MTSGTESLTSPFFQKTFILKRPEVAILTYIMKIVTISIKTILKDSEKLKELETIYLNGIYICIS